MASALYHAIIFLAFCYAGSLMVTSNALPAGVNDLLAALSPSATGKPGTDQYTIRNFMDDRYKSQLAFLNEICPPLARVVDQVCQSMQTVIQRCINFFTGGAAGGAGRGETDSTTEGTTDSSSSGEGSAEETTPSSGNGYDQSNPKFGGSDQSTSSESSGSSESTSSSESSSENSTDKPSG